MAAALFFLPYQVATHPSNFTILPGAQLKFYLTGTTTPVNVWTTSALNVSAGSTITANGGGRFDPFYLNTAVAYRLIILDKDGTELEDIDPFIPGTVPSAGALSPYQDACEDAAVDAAASASSASTSATTAAASATSAATSATNAASSATSASAAENAIIAALAEGGSVDLATLESSGLPVHPEWFGALGDGSTDDTAAFVAMSAYINAADGGAIELTHGKTYIVGGQALATAPPAFMPVVQYLIDVNACTRGVVIRGNGARIKCKASAKYGTFNRDGTVMSSTAPYSGDGLSTPYYAMIRATGCSGGVKIENLDLDGNIASATIGGEWGDLTRQIPMNGILLDANTCHVEISNVNSHGHGEDGIQLVWAGADENDSRYPMTLVDCDFISNGRQGMSWVGGKAVTAINCRFNDTGKNIGSMPASTPGAGVDIEAESSVCREGHFINCEFSNNSGPNAMSVGDSADVQFDHCKFIGTTSASYYGNGADKSYRWNDCLFVGQLVNLYPNADRYLASQFRNCRFLFGTSRSPTGAVYVPGGTALMMDLGGYGQQNISFDNCQWDSEGNTSVRMGYFDTANALFNNCEFTQDGTGDTIIRGIFSGNNKLTTAGAIISDGSVHYGRSIFNGAENIKTVPGPLAAGSTISATSYISGTALQATGLFVDVATPQVRIGYGYSGTDRGWIQATNPGVVAKPLTIAAGTDITLSAPAVLADGTIAATGTVSGSNLTTGGLPASVATGTIIGRVAGGTGAASALTGTQATTLLDAATTSLQGAMSAQDKTRLNALPTWYRTLLDCSGYLTDADAAGTYGMGQGDKCAITGTGTLYPLNSIYIAAADFPAVGTLNPKLRIRAAVHCNDVAPGVTFTIGLHPITRPATSGGAGLCIYTIGSAVASSTIALATPAADSSNVVVTAADFSLPSDGHYVIGVVTSGGALAASSHVHITTALQLRYA